jgi:alpha-ketoglutaric semialdehyde dehydrogenase
MRPALVLIDLQHDFLQHADLAPVSSCLIAQTEKLLSACRTAHIPVFHVWTRVRRDGNDRMPHWQRDDTWLCVEGSEGQLPPAALSPAGHETVFTKQFYSAFSSPGFGSALEESDIDTLIVAGVHLHGCVRATVLDAYARGLEIIIAEDAVGSYQPVHAEITRQYMNKRVAQFRHVDAIISELIPKLQQTASTTKPIAVGCIGGRWLAARNHDLHVRHDPSNLDHVMAVIPKADASEVQQACSSAVEKAQQWQTLPPAERAAVLRSWAATLSGQEHELGTLLADEIGKPIADGLAEIQRAIALINTSIEHLGELRDKQVNIEGNVVARLRPRGVIALITPWNNPIAIPVGKLAPALAYGNTVVWKPAIEAPATAMAIMDAYHNAGGMPGSVNMVFGDADTARGIISHPGISTVSLTGSVETGQATTALCCHYGKELQAELGGNNAAIVLRDCNIRAHAHDMALSAFSFAGQRCTAIRRFIVEKSVLDSFVHEFSSAVQNLSIGDPHDKKTVIGPLISASHREAVLTTIKQAIDDGAQLLCGAEIPDGLEHGCWLTPAVIGGATTDSHIAREETFGPVAAILPAEDLHDAIRIANSVKHGLVATLYSNDRDNRQMFSEHIEAGILNFEPGPVTIHPRAPFGGWKASGTGPPEHGIWDQQFYCRPQAVYGLDDL